MKKTLLFVAAAATLTFVTPALAAPMHDHAAVTGHIALDPITDADLLALGLSSGNAKLTDGAALDPLLDADLLALGLSSGNATLTDGADLDPLLDADLLAISPATASGGATACCSMAATGMSCGHR